MQAKCTGIDEFPPTARLLGIDLARGRDQGSMCLWELRMSAYLMENAPFMYPVSMTISPVDSATYVLTQSYSAMDVFVVSAQGNVVVRTRLTQPLMGYMNPALIRYHPIQDLIYIMGTGMGMIDGQYSDSSKVTLTGYTTSNLTQIR